MAETGRHAARAPRYWRAALLACGGAVLIGAAGSVLSTVLVARVVVTPPRRRSQETHILAVDTESKTITLRRDADNDLPGRYGLWFSRDTGHARLGPVVTVSEHTVTRELLGIDFGDIESASHGRLSGWFHLLPGSLGFPVTPVDIPTSLGDAPAWVVETATTSTAWVIQVHGRGATKSETIRAIPAFRAAGYNTVSVSWRNDGDAPASADARYALGDTEWLDVEAAIRFVLNRGATRVVLMGWSMGGAIVLQTITRSSLAPVVRAVVLESPVVDWKPTLDFQAGAMRVPKPVRRAVLALLGGRLSHRLTGQDAPIDFRKFDFVARAGELDMPVLLMHSEDDGFVPPTASHLLAQSRPDIVTFRNWTGARHARLWNFDTARFDREITEWLERLPD